MASPFPERAPLGILGPDPGRTIRIWVTMLLRLGIGLSLLGTGLSGYFGQGVGGGMGGGLWGRGTSLSLLDPFMSGMPYLAIGIGLALILGFLTTASAIAAGFFGLLPQGLAIVQLLIQALMVRGTPGSGGRFTILLETMVAMSLPNLLTNAAMIWLSPLENNPFSVDSLIFGRNEMEPMEPRPEPIPAPEPVVGEPAPLQIGE